MWCKSESIVCLAHNNNWISCKNIEVLPSERKRCAEPEGSLTMNVQHSAVLDPVLRPAVRQAISARAVTRRSLIVRRRRRTSQHFLHTTQQLISRPTVIRFASTIYKIFFYDDTVDWPTWHVFSALRKCYNYLSHFMKASPFTLGLMWGVAVVLLTLIFERDWCHCFETSQGQRTYPTVVDRPCLFVCVKIVINSYFWITDEFNLY